MFRRSKVCTGLMLAFGGLYALPTLAQDQAPQRVEITGSSVKRIDAETALPVTVIKRADIEKLGVTSTEQLLSTVTATSFTGAATSAEGAGLSTYGLASVSLRGLGANRTLVLVNGRRLAYYATDGTTVDVNSIPLSAVDRVEVLRDGASSLYGTDAVAGVVNFILRENYHGIEASANVGTSTRGGGSIYKAGVVGGWGDYDRDRFNLLLSLDLTKEDPLYGRQRADFAGQAWTNDGRLDISATPSGALRGPWDPALGNLVSQQKLSSLGNPLSPGNCATNGSAFDANLGTCRFNPSPLVPLVVDSRRMNLAGHLDFKVNEATKVFAEAFYTHAKIITLEQPSPISASFLGTDQAFIGTGVPQSILLTPSNVNYPTAFLAANAPTLVGRPISVSYRAFDAGQRQHSDTSDQWHVATGLTGSLKDWDYSLVLSSNTSKVSESTENGYMSQLALVQLLNASTTFNPFVQFQDPALAAQIRATNFNGKMIDSSLSNDGIDGKVSRSLFDLAGGAASIAVGASVRHEKMAFEPTAVYMTGDISGYGAQALPIHAGRTIYSLYSELDAPITKEFDVDASVRDDRYPGKDTTNPKLSLRWQPVPSLLFRAAAGNGFRSPALPELYTPQTIGTTSTFRDPVTHTLGQFTQILGGNPNLKPETSTQHSLGVVFEPTKDLSFGVDYFHVKVRNTIQALDPRFIVDQAAAGNPQYTGLVTRDAAGNIVSIQATNLNAGATIVSGYDVDAKWRAARFPVGDLTLALNGTYMSGYDVILPDGTIQKSVARTVDEQGNLLAVASASGTGSNGGGIVMRWRHALTVGLSNPTWSVYLTQNFQTGYGDAPDVNGDLPPPHVPSFTTYDLQANYTGIKDLKVTLGVKNLFDKNPPFVISNGNYFQTGYDPTYYDPRARFVYVAVNYKFR